MDSSQFHGVKYFRINDPLFETNCSLSYTIAKS